MQERPQLLLAEALVVSFLEGGPQEDGARPEGGEQLQGDDLLVGQVHLDGQAADVQDLHVGADALLWRERRERREGEGGVRGEVMGGCERSPPPISPPRAPLCLHTHRRLGQQGVLIPLKHPVSRLWGPGHGDGQVVGDEDDAGGGWRGREREKGGGEDAAARWPGRRGGAPIFFCLLCEVTKTWALVGGRPVLAGRAGRQGVLTRHVG